jgi:drug/metabolite transporter (DMT)-like permease
MSEIHRHNLKRGIYYMLIGWVFLATVALFIRLDSPRIPLSINLFAMNLLGFLCTLPVIFRYGWKDLKTNRKALMLFRALTGLFSFLFLFLSIGKISLTNALLLNNSAPLFLPLVCLLWLRVRIDARLWLGIILGFIGICFILKPGKSLFDIGAFYGLMGGITVSFGMLATRLLTFTERHHTVLFYYFLIPLLIITPFAIHDWQPIGFVDFLYLIFIGVGAFLGMLCMVKSFHYAKASQIGPFTYAGVIYGFIYDMLIFHHTPDLFSLIGVLLVISGGILTILLSRPPPSTPMPSVQNEPPKKS